MVSREEMRKTMTAIAAEGRRVCIFSPVKASQKAHKIK